MSTEPQNAGEITLENEPNTIQSQKTAPQIVEQTYEEVPLVLETTETKLDLQQPAPDPSMYDRILLNSEKKISKTIILLGKPFDRVKNYLLYRNKYGDRDFFSLTRTIVQLFVLGALGVLRAAQLNNFIEASWEFMKQALKALVNVVLAQLTIWIPEQMENLTVTWNNITQNLTPWLSAAPDWLKASPQFIRQTLLGQHANYAWALLLLLLIGKAISWFAREYKVSKQPGLQPSK